MDRVTPVPERQSLPEKRPGVGNADPPKPGACSMSFPCHERVFVVPQVTVGLLTILCLIPKGSLDTEEIHYDV